MSECKIENMIYVIRGQRVMLDSDLAELYGVNTKRLNEQVKRNLERFPEDFMFQLSDQEVSLLSEDHSFHTVKWGGRRYNPFAFTECGIAMLSSVLSSSISIAVNISIMRTFVRLRSYLSIESAEGDRLSKLEQNSNKLFRAVFERLDDIDDRLRPKLNPNRKKIGL